MKRLLKKSILCLLAACMLLCACNTGGTGNEDTVTDPEAATAPETLVEQTT